MLKRFMAGAPSALLPMSHPETRLQPISRPPPSERPGIAFARGPRCGFADLGAQALHQFLLRSRKLRRLQPVAEVEFKKARRHAAIQKFRMT